MSLRLITGLANAGKTGEILEEALAAAAAGESPTVAVPGLPDVRRLESELSGKAPLGVRVVSLRRFKLELWQQHGDGRRVVGRLARDAILQRVLQGVTVLGLAGSVGTPGFARLLAGMARDSREGDAGLAASSQPAEDLRLLMRAYFAALRDEGMVEESWLGDLIGAVSPQLDGPLGVARFDTLAPSDLGLIMGLARGNRVSLALTWDKGAPATHANDSAVESLSALSDVHLVLPEPVADNEIQRLARGLYGRRLGLGSTGSVVWGMATGGQAETALVARFAAREIAQGVPAERVAIVFPHAGARLHDLQNALDAQGLAADFDVVRPLSSTSFGRALLGLMALASGRGGRADALAFVSSPFSGVARDTAHKTDRRWRKERISDPERLMTAIGRLGSGPERAIELAREAAQHAQDGTASAGWHDLADALLSTGCGGMRPAELGRRVAEDVAAHAAAIRAFCDAGLGVGGSLGPSDLAKSLLAVVVTGGGEETVGRVQVCDFHTVGARRFDVMILGGLTESELPQSGSGASLDELQTARSSFAEGEPGDRLRLEFYALVTRARHRLYLVRQEADSEGRACRASSLWEDARDVYSLSEASPQADAACPSPCERLSRADIEESAPALTRHRRLQRRFASDLRLRTLDRGAVATQAGLSAIGEVTDFSATEIEAYLECPYRWFYERVVRPEEIDAALDARELGARAHRLLAEFYRRIIELPGLARVTPEWLETALELFEDVAASDLSESLALEGLGEELAMARAVSWARDVVERDAQWLPGFVCRHVERGFGGDVPFSFAGYAFRGRIDRVDMAPGSAFVIDYKSSRDVPGVAKFEKEGKVQAVVYACAAQQVLGVPVSGSVYRSMRSGRVRGFWRSDLLGRVPPGMCEDDAVDADGFDALVARTEGRVAEAIAGMRGGRIPRVPTVKNACDHCAIFALCEGARR